MTHVEEEEAEERSAAKSAGPSGAKALTDQAQRGKRQKEPKEFLGREKSRGILFKMI